MCKCICNWPLPIYISLVFLNACHVLSHCNTRIRLLYLLNKKNRIEEEFLNRAAVGWAVSCSAFGLFYYFIFLVLSVSRPKLPLGLLSSPDDVIISQLQAISQLFSSYPPSGAFVKLAN